MDKKTDSEDMNMHDFFPHSHLNRKVQSTLGHTGTALFHAYLLSVYLSDTFVGPGVHQ